MGAAVQAVLSEAVLEALQFKAISGHQVAWVQGRLEADPSGAPVGVAHARPAALSRACDGPAGAEAGGPGAGPGHLHQSCRRGVCGCASPPLPRMEGPRGPLSGIHTMRSRLVTGVRAAAVDERLSEVAAALGRAGISTEWGANALLVFGGRVVVRKGAAGSDDLLLNGVCGSEYYRVQAVLYQQTHVS